VITGKNVKQLITWNVGDETDRREIRGLLSDFLKRRPLAATRTRKPRRLARKIKFVPLWKWLLNR